MEKFKFAEQWKHYNPLDKRSQDINFEKSNKYPYCKPEKDTTIDTLLQPKISSVGVIPIRKTSQVNEMGVMVIGKSNLGIDKDKDKEITKDNEDPDEQQIEFVNRVKKSKLKPEKMPAIVSSTGTTGKISFSERRKPKATPMTKLKGHVFTKPSLIPAPPNSRTSKRTSSRHSSRMDGISSNSQVSGKQLEAPPSSPSDKQQGEVEFATTEEVRDVGSARSVDDIIKSLRTSREGTEVKSSSDLRIDELLKQVLGHSEEWTNKEEQMKSVEEENVQVPVLPTKKDRKRLSTSDAEEDIDVSDTVSTLASQISAPAGIPDVAAILLRKSSETAQRWKQDSDYSGFSTPVLGGGDADDYVDAAQAFRDLNRSLDVTNEDIICVEGKPAPLVKYQTTSDDEGYYGSGTSSGSATERFHPADLSSTITTGGRIHHLCLLAANSSSQFGVSPSDAAISQLTHAVAQRRNALETNRHFTNKTKENATDFPPAPPPSQAHTMSVADDTSATSQYGLNQEIPSVLQEVEEYNKQVMQQASEETALSRHQIPSEQEETKLDTSKIDPLDMNAWRQLADNVLENKNMTQQGETCFGRESSIWRLIWDPAPPKMLLPPVAIKAALFPQYHGSQMASGSVDGVKTELDMDESESETEADSEEKKHEFNLLYLNRRHKSEEDLSEISKRKSSIYIEESVNLGRSNSIPDISEAETTEEPIVKMNSDYSTAMEELRQQRMQAMEKERETMLMSATMPDSSAMPTHDIAQQPSVGQVQDIKATKSTKFMMEPLPPEQRLSLAELSRQGGQDYIPYRRKSRKKSIKKNFPLVQEVRRILASYIPVPLKRSRSLDTICPVQLPKAEERPLTRRSTHRTNLHSHLSRSLPRDLNFQEFIDRHDDVRHDDIREWVRDIWNEWFDEAIPPSVADDDDSWSTSSSEPEESETIEDQKQSAAIAHPGSGSSSAEKSKLPTKIPDVLQPVVIHTATDDYQFVDEETTVDVMEKEVERISIKIQTLLETETSTKAILLSKRGAMYRKLGQIKLATEDLNEALSLEPRLSAAYWHRHLIKLLENKSHEALDDLNILLKLNKQHVHAYRSRADIFASLGDFTMAIVNYTQAVKLSPNDEEAYFQRAQLYEKKGDMLLALEDYGSVVRINPSRTDALLKRGRFHFSHGNWHSTIADFTLMIQREPNNALARTYRGRAYASMKQYESALADLSASIHLDPLNWRAFYHRACLLRTLAPEKSLQDFSCSLLINDTFDNAMALLHRGILYTELKRYPEAVVDFEEALRLDHGLACAHVNIGLVHHQITRNYLEAIRHFTNAINVDPTYTRAYMCRADSYEQVNEYKRALHDVTRAIVQRPDDRHLYLRRGQLLLQLGELKLAGFCVRHIATLGEGIVSTSATQQAVVQSFLKNHDIAVNSLTAACKVKPVPHMYVLLGKTLMKAKKFKDAIFNFKNALDLLGSYSFSSMTSQSEFSQNQSSPEESSEIHFLLGQCYTQLEQHSRALSSYNNALKANSSHALAFYHRGLCRLKMDHSKGVQDLNRALALDPTLFEAYLSRAAFYGTKGRYSKAILNCNEALRLRSTSVRAYLYRGALKFHIKSYQLAVQDLTCAIKLERTCSLAYFNRATCFQRMKKYREALKDYSIVLMLDESNPEVIEDDKNKKKTKQTVVPLKLRVCVNRGLLYLKDLDDAHNAALDFELVTEMQPKNIKVLHTMALCYHMLKLLDKAIESYTRCLSVDPYFLAGYIGRGDAYADAKDVVSSRYDYQRALKLNPTCVSARINLGYSLQSIGKLHQAWLQFSRAIELDEKSQQALEGRAVTCLRAGNIDAAFQDITAAFRAGNPTARLHAARGVIHQYMGDVKSAMSDYQRAVKLDGSYSVAFFNAAALYLRDRRFREALAYLDKAVQITPEDDAALTNRGIARVLLNDTERALDDFNDAIKYNNTNAHTFYNRGNLLNMLKRYKEAEMDYTTAFTVDPSDYGALKKRADVRGKLGKREQAIGDYREALELYERKKFLAGAA
ncbi:uncharacterized protein LOC120326538 [Styela clava]